MNQSPFTYRRAVEIADDEVRRRLGAELVELRLLETDGAENKYLVRWRYFVEQASGSYGTHVLYLRQIGDSPSFDTNLTWGCYDMDEAASKESMRKRMGV